MKVVCALAFALLVAATPLRGHHSFAAEYDGAKPVTLSGTVARVDWQNPHIYFYLDVKNDRGAVTQWKVEGYPPNMLVRQGWKKDVTMKVGDTISVSGWRARSDEPLAAGREVTFGDGKKLNCGPPAGTGGQ
jgi:hypothetical protein